MAALLLCASAGLCSAAAGLTASYYNNITLTGSPALVRVDSTVSTDWGTGSPDPVIGINNFSARWVGVVRAQTSGNYTFQTKSDDGVRLYVNNSLVINNWTVHGATLDTSSSIALTAGIDYPITLEFYENSGGAVMQLSWKKPGDSAYSIIPASNGSLGLATGLTPILEYRFEEPDWVGNSGEVLDTSGNGWNGTAAGLSTTKPTTAIATPAVAGSSGTCRYGVFNRANKDYVALPSAFPNLGVSSSFTATGWIRTTDRTQSGQRIVADDENGYGSTSVGYVFSLGDRGAGMLNFVSRATGGTYEVITPAVISNNTWYFVAFGVDITSKTQFVQVFDTSGTQLASVSTTYTASSFGSDSGAASLGGETNAAGGGENTSSFGFAGNLDEIRVYSYVLSASELGTVRTIANACPTAVTLVAEYRFEQPSWSGAAGELLDTAGYAGGPYNGQAQGSPLPSSATASPARSASPGTCGYASLPGSNGTFAVTGLPTTTTAGAQTSLAFWMYWDGSDSRIPIAFNIYDLWLYGGSFGFNTGASDVYGISSSGLANGWHHVAATFTNGTFTGNRLYIDGVRQTLSQRVGTPNYSSASTVSTLTIGGYGAGSFRFTGRLDELRVYLGAVSDADVAAAYAATHPCGPHHVELRHGTGTGLTCTPSTLTIAACQDAACSTLSTTGLTGTLTASGSGMTVNWPAGATFSIPVGSSSTTLDMQQTTVGSVTVGATGLSPAPTSSTTCNFGSPSCTYTAADSGLLFDVPLHRAEVSNTVSVTAVKKSDNSAACVPAFASVSKSVTFKCSYLNPASGTQAVRVGGTALNSANNASAACDAGGRAVSLSFDSTGKADTTVMYADVGNMTLAASYTGSGSDASLVMSGTDTFIAVPYSFAVTGISAGPLVAGSSFGATVSAKNYIGATTPNFGRETAAEGVTLGYVRAKPTGTGAVNGSFSGAVGAFSSGAASGSNLVWSEVGRGDVSAVLTSGSYLGSGLSAAGSSAGAMVSCANEGGTCTLPTGATATVVYGALGRVYTRAGQTGSVACSNGVFGDPYVGYGKTCSYIVTSGTAAGTAGSAGDFKPHHFDVAVTPSCGTFSYAGQPFAATLTARNASNATTLNYDGSANTSPNYAKSTTLSDSPVLGSGTWAGNTLASSAYTAGVASATPSYAYTNKLTAAQTLITRAIDADSVSSAGYAEGQTALRSGRLKVSNAFGSEKAALAVGVQAQYWSGNAWVQNTADSCTTVPAAAVVRAGYLDNKGTATIAWTSSVSAITISAGSGTLTIGAPSPTATGSLDFAFNLGSTATDQSCLGAHPASTGAALPWLRTQNGSSGACSSAWDRDPSARANFGIYTPETRKTVHVRELF